MAKTNIMYVTLVISVLAFTGIQILISTDVDYFEEENRIMARKPEVSLENVLCGKFQEDMENCLKDQLPFRKHFVTMATTVKKVEGKRDLGGAYIGNNDYYFEKITDENINYDNYISNLENLKKSFERNNVDYKLMLIPNAGIILKDKLPRGAKMYDYDKCIEKAEEVLGTDDVVDVKQTLENAYLNDNSLYLYYKTDHHWTCFGAQLAYKKYAQSAGISLVNRKLDVVAKDFYGTLYSKVLDNKKSADIIYAPIDLPETIIQIGKDKMSSPYVLENKNIKDKYKIFFGDNYGLVSIKTGINNGKKLLVIKDSFANCFVPFLFENYEEIVMIDYRFFSGSIDSIIDEMGIENVLVLYGMSNFANDTNICKVLM